MIEKSQRESVTFTFLLGGRSVCGQEHRPERCEGCSEMTNCILDSLHEALSKAPSATDNPVVSSPIKHMLDAIKAVQRMKKSGMPSLQKSDSSIYLIGESEIDAGANAISNIFKMGGLNEDQTTELNIALEQFKSASNSPIATASTSNGKNQNSDDDEPDLHPISNCLKKEIVITPEICTKFWTYRADSGHLDHLLMDLVGEEFFMTHRQDECIEKVLNEWMTPEERAEHERKRCEVCYWKKLVITAPKVRIERDGFHYHFDGHPEEIISLKEHDATVSEAVRAEMLDERITDIELIISLCKTLRHNYPDDHSLEMTETQHRAELKKLESLRGKS